MCINSEERPTLQLARRMRQVFVGRDDVFATKWVSKRTGRKGYSFACANKFKTGCRIGKGQARACEGCPARKPLPLTEDVLVRHLTPGPTVVGVYPLVHGFVRFGAVDLDDHSDGTVSTAPRAEDTPLAQGARVVEEGRRFGVPLWLERSGGGRGAHVWVFFAEWLEAEKARRLLQLLVQLAGLPDALEIFPKQSGDSEYGSLIALPYQNGPANWLAGRSVFVDPDTLERYQDPLHVMAQIEARHAL
jgi:hypothetical protein